MHTIFIMYFENRRLFQVTWICKDRCSWCLKWSCSGPLSEDHPSHSIGPGWQRIQTCDTSTTNHHLSSLNPRHRYSQARIDTFTYIEIRTVDNLAGDLQKAAASLSYSKHSRAYEGHTLEYGDGESKENPRGLSGTQERRNIWVTSRPGLTICIRAQGGNSKDHHVYDSGQGCVCVISRCAEKYAYQWYGSEEASLSLFDVRFFLDSYFLGTGS